MLTDIAADNHSWGSLVQPSEALRIRRQRTTGAGSSRMNNSIGQKPVGVMGSCAKDVGLGVWRVGGAQRTKFESRNRMVEIRKTRNVVADPKALAAGAVEEGLSSTLS